MNGPHLRWHKGTKNNLSQLQIDVYVLPNPVEGIYDLFFSSREYRVREIDRVPSVALAALNSRFPPPRILFAICMTKNSLEFSRKRKQTKFL